MTRSIKSFDSKLVRLKDKYEAPSTYLFNGFDSKLVRLKDVLRNRVLELRDMFRFQTGSIKS